MECGRMKTHEAENELRKAQMQPSVGKFLEVDDPKSKGCQPLATVIAKILHTSKPPISWDANAKPETVNDKAPRRASAIASQVDSQSPPQWTGKLDPLSHFP